MIADAGMAEWIRARVEERGTAGLDMGSLQMVIDAVTREVRRQALERLAREAAVREEFGFPADAALGLHGRAQSSPRLQEICALMTLLAPAGQAERDVRSLSGVAVCASTMHREARRQGERPFSAPSGAAYDSPGSRHQALTWVGAPACQQPRRGCIRNHGQDGQDGPEGRSGQAEASRSRHEVPSWNAWARAPGVTLRGGATAARPPWPLDAPPGPTGRPQRSPGQGPAESAGGCHEPRRGSSTAMAARVLGYRRGAIP